MASTPTSAQASSLPNSTTNDDTDLGGGSSGGSSTFSNIASGLGQVASSSAFPYLATGALGLYEGSQAASQNNAKVNQLQSLATPLLSQEQQLLNQYNTGTLNPAQQQVVSLAQQQGQQLIDSASPLYGIATGAFQQYQAGQLQPWQQTQIDSWTSSQKSALAQQFASMGMSTDSTQFIQQSAAIDSQAENLKANLMSQNFQVGDQAFSQWLTTTQAGQQTQLQGKQYAVQSLDSMLTSALGFGTAGQGPVQSAVQLGVQSDNQLSGNIQQLMTGLATAYAKSTYSSTNGGGSNSNSILGGVKTMLGFGSNNPSVPASAQAGAQQQLSTDTQASMNQVNSQVAQENSDWLNQQNLLQNVQLDTPQLDTSAFFDPSGGVPDISFDTGGD